MARRVVVTGLGIVSPLGNTTEASWTALVEGRAGMGPITSFPCESFPVKQAGEVRNFNPCDFGIKPKTLKVMNRAVQYAVAAAWLARHDARLSRQDYRPEQIGLTLGVEGIQYSVAEGLLSSYEAVGRDMRNHIPEELRGEAPIRTNDPGLTVHPLWPLSVLANMSLCHIAIQNNFQGPNLAFSSSDAGGSQAVGEAFRLIRQGAGDIFFAGGGYGLNTVQLASMSSLNLLSEASETCRPFDRRRDGCLLGEGAAVLVLEALDRARQRGAPVYAEIIGFSSLCSREAGPGQDGSDLPDPESFRTCIQTALRDAGIDAGDVDYINADGCGSIRQDAAEARALMGVFGARAPSIPLSSSKPLTGHMLPAAGAFDAAATALSVHRGCIPPTLNCSEPDEACRLSVSPKARHQEITHAVSNTFGLTGEHASLIFKKIEPITQTA